MTSLIYLWNWVSSHFASHYQCWEVLQWIKVHEPDIIFNNETNEVSVGWFIDNVYHERTGHCLYDIVINIIKEFK